MQIETEGTTTPVCPYCGHEERNWWDCGFHDGDDRRLTCGSCGGEYLASISMSASFRTLKIEGLEPTPDDLERVLKEGA